MYGFNLFLTLKIVEFDFFKNSLWYIKIYIKSVYKLVRKIIYIFKTSTNL